MSRPRFLGREPRVIDLTPAAPAAPRRSWRAVFAAIAPGACVVAIAVAVGVAIWASPL